MILRLLSFLSLLVLLPTSASAETLRVGSKNFTESVILADMATYLAQARKLEVEHRRQLGGTELLFAAVERGELDLYPEYIGTLTQQVFANERPKDDQELTQLLAARGLAKTASLGFENGYSLAMLPERARALGISRMSDLASHADLRYALDIEFLHRSDGWNGLLGHYGFRAGTVHSMEHDLVVRALADGSADVADLFQTDAEIPYYGFTVLEDDRRYFPAYDAVYVYRRELTERAPSWLTDLAKLEGSLSETEVANANAKVKLHGENERQVAADLLRDKTGVHTTVPKISRAQRVLARTLEHVRISAVALFVATLLAIPLGVLCARRRKLARAVLAVASVLQTIPSLALLVFLLPLLGLGEGPAMVALILYGLLPIVRNTYTGLVAIPTGLQECATVLSLSPGFRLFRIELPMALPSILAGMQIAAVTTVGTATLGALVGAGGYGQPILTGIRLNRTDLVLEGALPAACLAVLVLGLFELAERRLVPRGLRAH